MVKQNIYDDPAFFEGYRRLRANPASLNDVLEQPALKRCLPELSGLDVLDLGCGMGQLARYCAAQGAASVLGTDISTRMIAVAEQEAAHPRVRYLVAAMEDLDLPPAQFDLVVSSLALHYVADYGAIVRKVARWLRPGGRFVYSVHHPILSARRETGWIEDAAGARLYWPVDDYADEGPREAAWFIPGVIDYHRTLATLLNELIESRLTIERILEPEATPEGVALRPSLHDERRRPPFLIVRARRPQ